MNTARVGYFVPLNGPLNGHPPSFHYDAVVPLWIILPSIIWIESVAPSASLRQVSPSSDHYCIDGSKVIVENEASCRNYRIQTYLVFSCYNFSYGISSYYEYQNTIQCCCQYFYPTREYKITSDVVNETKCKAEKFCAKVNVSYYRPSRQLPVTSRKLLSRSNQTTDYVR